MSKSDKSDQMKNLVKVFAYAQIKDEKKTERKARFLKAVGLGSSEIADLLGITPRAVRLALAKSKKDQKTDEIE